jgi:hypothetical protein
MQRRVDLCNWDDFQQHVEHASFSKPQLAFKPVQLALLIKRESVVDVAMKLFK